MGTQLRLVMLVVASLGGLFDGRVPHHQEFDGTEPTSRDSLMKLDKDCNYDYGSGLAMDYLDEDAPTKSYVRNNCGCTHAVIHVFQLISLHGTCSKDDTHKFQES